MKYFLGLLLCFGLALLSPLAHSDEVTELEAEGVRIWKMLPRASEMIRHPSPEGWEIYTVSRQPKAVSVKDVPGGKSLRLKIKKAGKNAWDMGANGKTQLATKKNDVLPLAPPSGHLAGRRLYAGAD